MAVDHQQLFKDNFAKREVLCLNVLCSAQEHGCSWHGELRDLQVRTPITNCYWWGVDGADLCDFIKELDEVRSLCLIA